MSIGRAVTVSIPNQGGFAMKIYKDAAMTQPITQEEYEAYGIGNVEPLTAEEAKAILSGPLEIIADFSDPLDDRVELTEFGLSQCAVIEKSEPEKSSKRRSNVAD
jgi:hypothetical protein